MSVSQMQYIYKSVTYCQLHQYSSQTRLFSLIITKDWHESTTIHHSNTEGSKHKSNGGGKTGVKLLSAYYQVHRQPQYEHLCIFAIFQCIPNFCLTYALRKLNKIRTMLTSICGSILKTVKIKKGTLPSPAAFRTRMSCIC